MEIKALKVAPIRTNCYIVSNGDDAFIVDPGGSAPNIIEAAKGFSIKYILMTHTHYDHIGALNDVAEAFPDAKVALHSIEKGHLYDPYKNFSIQFGLDFRYLGEVHMELADGALLPFADSNIRVIHTPGHTPGGVCFSFKNVLFSGDTLFKQSVGRTDLPGGDTAALFASIKEKLYVLPGDTVVYPGHEGSTTIAWERTKNSYVKL
ncbi:MAG: MBL fold metallo-hydrolase [bacterium]